MFKIFFLDKEKFFYENLSKKSNLRVIVGFNEPFIVIKVMLIDIFEGFLSLFPQCLSTLLGDVEGNRVWKLLAYSRAHK